MNKKLITIVIFSCFLTGCDQGNSEVNDKSSKELVNSSIANMIPVQRGEFLMGDFGSLVGENIRGETIDTRKTTFRTEFSHRFLRLTLAPGPSERRCHRCGMFRK
jgi:hypothetical protein